MTRFALATSVIGQGGSYHSEFLLGEGFDVHGTKCHTSLFNTDRIDSLYQPPTRRAATSALTTAI